MKSRVDLENRVRTATKAVLPSALVVEVQPHPTTNLPIVDVVVKTEKVSHHFIAGWAGEGWPADVRGLLGFAPKVDVAYAKRVSDGAKAWLDDHHVGWVDETGAASISLPSGLIVAREGHAIDVSRPHTDRWTRTMLTAAEAILAGTPPTVEAVEAATG